VVEAHRISLRKLVDGQDAVGEWVGHPSKRRKRNTRRRDHWLRKWRHWWRNGWMKKGKRCVNSIIRTWNWGWESDWCGGSGGACAGWRNGYRGPAYRRGRASFRRDVGRCGTVCREAECGWDRRIRRADDRRKNEPPPILIQTRTSHRNLLPITLNLYLYLPDHTHQTNIRCINIMCQSNSSS